MFSRAVCQREDPVRIIAASPTKTQEPFRHAVCEALRFVQGKARGAWKDGKLLNQTHPFSNVGPTISVTLGESINISSGSKE